MKVLVQIVIRKITEDPNHPMPWQWNFAADTAVGYVTDKGLARSRDEALAEADQKFRQAVQDKQTRTLTAEVVKVEFDLDEILAREDA